MEHPRDLVGLAEQGCGDVLGQVAEVTRKHPPVDTAEWRLDEVVDELLSHAEGIALFDRAGFLQTATSRRIDTDGKPLYAVLGELFAASDKRLVWDASAMDDTTVLAISSLPPR